MKIIVETTKLFDSMGFEIPKQATKGSAGIDMVACIEHPITLGINQSVIDYELNGFNNASILSDPLYGRSPIPYAENIPTGIKMEIPEGYFGLAAPRSGLAFKYSVTLTNGPGIIDSDYRDEIQGIMINLGTEPLTINPGDRIFQLIILPYPEVDIVRGIVGSSDTRTGGFGSTGR